MSFGDSLAWPGFSCMSLAEFTVGLLQWAWDPIGTFGPEVSLGLPVVTISPSFLFLFFFVIILVFCKSLFIYPAVLGPSWGTQNLVVSRGIFCCGAWKNPPAMREILVRFLGWEKGTATHSSILAWRIPWTEEPGKLQFMGSQRIRCQMSDLHFLKGPCSIYSPSYQLSWH